jgi:hypothetical protein
MLYKDTLKDIPGYNRLSSEVCSKPILQLVNTVQRTFPNYVEKQALVLHRSTHLIVSSLRNWLILGRLIQPPYETECTRSQNPDPGPGSREWRSVYGSSAVLLQTYRQAEGE